MDQDEEDAGSITANYFSTIASNNTNDGYKHSEEGEGNNRGYVFLSTASDYGGKGFVYEEEDEGSGSLKVHFP